MEECVNVEGTSVKGKGKDCFSRTTFTAANSAKFGLGLQFYCEVFKPAESVVLLKTNLSIVRFCLV